MSLAGPGSVLWLLSYELRMAWRRPKARKGGRGVALVVVAVILLLFGMPIGYYLAHQSLALGPRMIAGADGALLLAFTLMMNVALTTATMAFYERGDLDLLLSSPLSGRKILAVRALGIAAGAAIWPMLLVTPFLLPIAAFGHWPWLAIYLVLGALGLLAAAAGIALAMALFRLSGPRAAKTVGQVVASLSGASVFIVSQSARIFPGFGRILGGAVDNATQRGWLTPTAPLSWPARAVTGEPLPLLVLVLVSVAVFVAAAHLFGLRFVTNAALGAGTPSGLGWSGPRRRDQGFAPSTFAAVMRKEWRLILRDPALISQVLVRLLYLLPLCFLVITRSGGNGASAEGLVGPLALIAGQLAGSLAWITLSAEDAPDLIAASPVTPTAIRRAKLTAALQPVAVLFVIPVFALAVWSPQAGAAAAVGSALAAVSAGLVNLWLEKPGQRSAFARRRSSASVTFSEIGVTLAWALAAGLAAGGSLWALAPAGLALLVLGVVKMVAEPDRAY